MGHETDFIYFAQTMYDGHLICWSGLHIKGKAIPITVLDRP